MNLTLSVDDEVLEQARLRAQSLGSSVNQLVREYLEQLAGIRDPNADADEFDRLSQIANDELHNRQ